MKALVAILFWGFFFVPQLFARDKSDVIVMNNGDHMTCEIKGLSDGVLYVSFDYIQGTSSVDWLKVHSLESKQLFIVTTGDGLVYTGAIKTDDSAAERPIRIVPAEASERPVAVQRSSVTSVTETSSNFWQRFNGNISTGVTYSKGNQSTQYNLGSSLAYVRTRWVASAALNSTLTANSGVQASTRNSLDLTARRLLPWNNWFYTGLGDFLQSSEQQIKLQENLGGGIGRYLKNTNRSTILVAGGLGWQNITYSEAIQSQAPQSVLAGFAFAQMKFFRFDRTNLTIDVSAFPALTQPGRIYAIANAAYYVKIFRKIDWNISFYGNWDNAPPPNLSGSNYGTTSGLSYSFGNR
jgi:putative salt-induced outer membrane protein YdiY